MATLEALQEQLATLKERYSAVIEGYYSAEESIATIAVNMQAQLDDAQEAASSAGIYASAAEASATVAAAVGAAAGAEAGASEAQTKYDAIFTEEHTWGETQTFYSLNVTKKADFRALSGQKGEFYSLNVTKQAAETGHFYSLDATKMEATEVNASRLKLDATGSNVKVQFDASQAQNGIDVNIAGYNYYSDGTSAVTDTTLHTRNIDVYSQAKASELRIKHDESEVIIRADARYSHVATLDISNRDSSAPNVVLTCYSAALQYCNVMNTLSVGQLQIGDATLSYSELTQLKALLNQ